MGRAASVARAAAAAWIAASLGGVARGQEPLPTPAPAGSTVAAGAGEEVPTPTPTPIPARALGVADRKRELEQLRKRLGDLRVRYAAARRRKADLEESVAAVRLHLEIQVAERRVVEIRYVEAEREAGRVTRERDAAAARVTRLRGDLGFRAAALYRMGRLGYIRALVAAESGDSLLRGLQVMTHLARRDARLLAEYEEALRALATREQEVEVRRDELKAVAAESRRKEADLAAARAEQERLLRRATHESETEEQAVASLEQKSERLAALLDLLETRGRALPPGAASIRRFRGVLDWPARGDVAVPFGRIANPKFPKTFLRSSGWTIDTPVGTSVHAVFAGDVVYAQWLKGYGNLVVLDHGDGVFTLYGRLGTGTVQRGDRIGVGDRVGSLGEPPEEEVPGLYFEIRDQRTSVDPREWLK